MAHDTVPNSERHPVMGDVIICWTMVDSDAVLFGVVMYLMDQLPGPVDGRVDVASSHHRFLVAASCCHLSANQARV